MTLHPLAGKKIPNDMLENIPRLMRAYYTQQPNIECAEERVAFGTSGHRGSSLDRSFNDDHIAAITQALCEYRQSAGITGPCFVGMDTHALSEAALATAIEVFAANEVEIHLQRGFGYTPTPVISHAILSFNHAHQNIQADGVVITPSHNPPRDGGFKYNPPSGGPADTKTTQAIEERANQILLDDHQAIKRIRFEKALSAQTTHKVDLMMPYVEDLINVVDLEAIANAKIKIGVDPMGGAGIAFWEPIKDRYKLDLEIVNDRVDPTFSFMRVDKDGKIRMDCSSPYAMASLIEHKDRFDIAVGNDPDYDRHGIVTRSAGLMNPNHYLAVAIEYLFTHRPDWPKHAAVGKTLVSSSMIDRVAKKLDRNLSEVPVGFKWFVDGLIDGSYGFGGEESAGASFLRKDGRVWTTDKDGIIMDLLAAEICAITEKDPAEHYQALVKEFGSPLYKRIDAPAAAHQKEILKKLNPDQVKAETLAGETITEKLTQAKGNNANIGGLKVVTENGWFAARPSGTEDIYKIYAESFKNETHLETILNEAQSIVDDALND